MMIRGGTGSIIAPVFGAAILVLVHHLLSGELDALVPVVMGVFFVTCVLAIHGGAMQYIQTLMRAGERFFMNELFTIFAIKYATVDRLRKDNFLQPVDGDPDAPMALDFFVWLVLGHGTVLLVDTGFSPASALARKRKYLVTPVEALRRLGYAPEDIKDLAITHLHYDHAGNIGEFPSAKVWVQEREVRYATGNCMCDPKQNHFFSSDDLGCLIKRLYHGNVRFVDGFHQLRDGIELHRVGGHTDGLQVLRVRTGKGWVVLASDAAHYYENLVKENPFPAIYSLDDMRKGYARIRELADGEGNIVPGHDPQVCLRFPTAGVPGIHAYRIA